MSEPVRNSQNSATGELGHSGPDLVSVANPDGTLSEKTASQLPDAIRSGATLATRGQVEAAARAVEAGRRADSARDYQDQIYRSMGMLGPVTAGSLGALRGLTMGMSDLAIPSLTQDTQAGKGAILGLQESAPLTSMAGELGGLALGAYATGGLSAEARAGQAALKGLAYSPAGLAARAGTALGGVTENAIARNAIKYGAENAIYSGSREIADSYLQDKNQSVSRILYHGLQGGLLGAGLGGGLTAMARAARPAEAAVEAGTASIKPSFLPEPTVTPKSAAMKELEKVAEAHSPGGWAEFSGKLKDAGYDVAAEGAGKDIEEAFNRVSANVGRDIKVVENVPSTITRIEVEQRARVALADQFGGDALENAKIAKDIARSLPQHPTVGQLWDASKGLKSVGGNQARAIALTELRQIAMEENVAARTRTPTDFPVPKEPVKPVQMAEPIYPPKPVPPTSEPSYQKFWNNESKPTLQWKETVSRMKEGWEASVAEAKSNYKYEMKAYKDALKAREKAIAEDPFATIRKQSPEMLQSEAERLNAQIKEYQLYAAAHHVMNKAEPAMAQAAKEAAKEAAFVAKNNKAVGLADLEPPATAEKPPKDADPAFNYAAMPLLGKMLLGKVGLSSMAFTAAKGAVSRAVSAIESTAAIRRAADAAMTDINSTAHSFVSGAGRAAQGASSDLSRKRFDAVSNAVRNPIPEYPLVTELTKVDHELADIARQKIQTIQANVSNQYAQLTTMRPGKGLENMSVAGKPVQPMGLSYDEMNFLRYVEAAEEPFRALRQAKAGRLSTTAVQSLQDNHPEILDEIRKSLFTAIATRSSTGVSRGMPIAKRGQLSLLLGTPVDYTTNPAFIQAIQNTYSNQPEAQPEVTDQRVGTSHMESIEGAAVATESEKIEEQK